MILTRIGKRHSEGLSRDILTAVRLAAGPTFYVPFTPGSQRSPMSVTIKGYGALSTMLIQRWQRRGWVTLRQETPKGRQYRITVR